MQYGVIHNYSVGQIIRNRIAIAVSEFLPVDSEIFCEHVGFTVTKEKGKLKHILSKVN